jgi:ABC-type Fe3+ transport system permease subunit
MNPQLEEAARDLGASAWGAFRYVTLPIILPAVIAGALLAFSLSFDDYVVTTFNSGVGSSTLPLYIYGKIKFGVTPEINAISTIIVAVTAIAILIAWRAGASERKPTGRSLTRRRLSVTCRVADRDRAPARRVDRGQRLGSVSHRPLNATIAESRLRDALPSPPS